ncbi:MAG: hypothetical protein IJ639_08045 [Ruminococcus sp.]|nr:hypothetical protein [Ruminococcus sp.]
MKKDYSEYQYTEYDKYLAGRTAPKGITLPFFMNQVRFSSDDKSFTIWVDSNFEGVSMKDDINQYEKEKAKREGKEYKTNEYKIDENAEGLKESKRLLSEMRKKYHYSDNMIDGFSFIDPELLTEPLVNVFSGAEIQMHYGEGILDFIYADFETPLHEELKKIKIEELLSELGKRSRNEIDEIFAELGKEYLADQSIIGETENNSTKKIYNNLQEYVELFFDYECTFIELRHILYSSLYTAICPPVINDALPGKKERVVWYANYILRLQREFMEMIEFCYDEDFYPKLLGESHPYERLHLYRRIHNLPMNYQRTEFASVDKFEFHSTDRPYGIKTNELIEILQNMNLTATDEANAFAKKYNISVEELMGEIKLPTFLNIGYRVRTIEDMLELEFTKMLEQDVRFRKCKRCGKYFIMKGNYDTKYCSRIAEGKTRSCQELAAIDNYKAKIADDKAIPIYNRYYKRYAARVKVHQIKEEDFKKWKYQAMDKRNQCSDGKITPEEYIEWMEASFPNRKQKPKE